MRFIKYILIVFISISFSSEAQVLLQDYKVLNKPHGKEIFFLKKGVDFFSVPKEYDDPWTEIYVECYVQYADTVGGKLKKGTVLYNYYGDSIGYVISPIEFDYKCFNHMHSVEPEMKLISFSGFIEEELEGDFFSHISQFEICDSCMSSIKYFRSASGQLYRIIDNCNIKIEWYDEQEIYIKEHLQTITLFGADRDLYKMDVEVVLNPGTDSIRIINMSSDGYEFTQSGEFMYFTEYPGTGTSDIHHQHSFETGECIMSFQGPKRMIRDSEYKEVLFLGYSYHRSGRWSSKRIGDIVVSNSTARIYSKVLCCNNPEIQEKIFMFEPEIVFKTHNFKDEISKDSTTFIIHEENKCPSDFKNIGFTIKLPSSIDDLILEFQFRDGELYIIENYQDAFYLED